ncbi:MAG TPA: hypothetical protein PLM56_10235 [Cyclobacteriaceae bacterium]|jgi:hypothetical protein|nr:hypothetical protein [Cytophagales bacterium]HRE67850.1 hypothetical protein [Cyclobacteriaceae bacterium]HRF33868.1 hypothetical protein [Cyclobacteriaceae bacterium]
MKSLLTLFFILNLTNNLHGQSVLDSILYIEIDTEKNYIYRNARYPDPILHKEKGIIVEIPESRYVIYECDNGGEFQFRSLRKEQAKTVSFRQLKKYQVITFPQLCAFLYALPDPQKVLDKWIRENDIPIRLDTIYPPSPIHIYLYRLKAIYFIEKDSKKKQATITQVYYYADIE